MSKFNRAVGYMIRSAELDQWQVLSDLLGLTTVLGAVAYAGGLAYVNTYYGAFSLSLDQVGQSVSSIALTFVQRVLLTDQNQCLLYVGAGVLCGSFYVARAILKPWLGYLVLCALVLGSLWVAVENATQTANAHAKRDQTQGETCLPTAKIRIKPELERCYKDINADLPRGVFVVVLDTDKNIYLILPIPQASPSAPATYILPKDAILYIDLLRATNTCCN